MKTKQLLRQTYAFYGKDQQTLKCVEELNELAMVLMHYRDGKASTVDVAEEVADVEIMCRKMRIMLGEDVCKEAKQKKLERLAEMFEEDKKVAAAFPRDFKPVEFVVLVENEGELQQLVPFSNTLNLLLFSLDALSSKDISKIKKYTQVIVCTGDDSNWSRWREEFPKATRILPVGAKDLTEMHALAILQHMRGEQRTVPFVGEWLRIALEIAQGIEVKDGGRETR